MRTAGRLNPAGPAGVKRGEPLLTSRTVPLSRWVVMGGKTGGGGNARQAFIVQVDGPRQQAKRLPYSSFFLHNSSKILMSVISLKSNATHLFLC
ncbi:MAG: hypothetical protein ACTSXP_09925 [Promethearchaeota archaeon]